MTEVAWAALGLLAAISIGNFWYLATKIDSVGDRIDAVGDSVNARIDALADRLDGRIDALASRLDARMDALSGQLQTHIEHHPN